MRSQNIIFVPVRCITNYSKFDVHAVPLSTHCVGQGASYGHSELNVGVET